jgi:IS5 family transposase
MTHRRCPAEGHENQERDLFRARLDEMIDMSHPLVRVSEAMPWETLIESVGESLPLVPVGPGRRPLPARLVLGLLYLKHAYDLSDEAVCARWLENPYYQYFCGEVFFQTQLPCDPSSLTRYRKRLGEAGVEELLSQTIEAAKRLKAVRRSDLKRVVVDSTIQEKDVAFPTDSRLLEVARQKVVEAARHEGIPLRQSYARVGPKRAIQAGRYAHAKQFKRMRKVLRKQRTTLGRLLRDIGRKASLEALERLAPTLLKAERLRSQTPKDKNKLYAWHAPEVECIVRAKPASLTSLG